MKRLFAILLCAATLAACVKDPTTDPQGTLYSDGFIEIPFSHRDFSQIRIETRSELPALIEARVTNIYVLIFDKDGTRVYGQFFDSSNRELTHDLLKESYENCWWVNNIDPDEEVEGDASRYSHGSIRMKVPEGTNVEGGHIYLIANLDEDMINISDGTLALVTTEDELKSTVGVFNQQSTSRTGLFLMTGYTGIDIDTNGNYKFGAGDGSGFYDGTYEASDNATLGSVIKLERIDAKVTVKVGVLPGYITQKNATKANGDLIYDEDGNPVISKQAVSGFTPTSWQVINLPKGAWLIPREPIVPGDSAEENAVRGDAPKEKSGGHWDSNINVFELVAGDSRVSFTNSTGEVVTDAEREEHHFAFYMLENRQSTNRKASVVSGETAEKYLKDGDGNATGIQPYHLRDKQFKQQTTVGTVDAGEYNYNVIVDSDGNVVERQQWEFAPEQGTYLIIKGEVTMEVQDSDSYQAQTMNAMVTYYIHLGAFGKEGAYSGLDNYDICRNTHYTYTINIKGVRQIEVEVDTDSKGWKQTNEVQSGNMGDVYMAQESIYTFDAHYGQRVFRFNADAIMRTAEADLLTWYVSGPFGRSGRPDRVGPSDVEVPTDLDYKWVHFALNRNNGTISMTSDGLTNEQKLNGTFNRFEEFYPEGTGAPANQKAYDADGGYFQYSQKSLWYPGEGAKTRRENPDRTKRPELMNVMDLCDLLREQVKLYIVDKENWNPQTGRYDKLSADYRKQSLFDDPLCYAEGQTPIEGDDTADMIISRKETVYLGDSPTPQEMDVPIYRGGNIYVTAFVDEFYYDFHPITGDEDADLWRQFVYTRENQMRMMHVLCDAKVSADESSSATGSVVTIRQRPIQTIYEADINRITEQRGTPLNEAWGCETIDETRKQVLRNDASARLHFYGYGSFNDDMAKASEVNGRLSGKTTMYNGRYNTAVLWDYFEPSVSKSWETYLDFERVNDYAISTENDGETIIRQVYWIQQEGGSEALDTLTSMRYACMMRNRDNNGNRTIDEDEIRWYLASTDQLVQLYIGELGISGDGQLYNTYDMNPNNFPTANANNFRSHIVSSSLAQQLIWAEEGCSTSGYNGDHIYGKPGRLSIRCVRNLGTATSDYSLSDPQAYPSSPISTTKEENTEDPGKTVYNFDLSNLTYRAKRNHSVNSDLTPMDELSESAMAYHHFKTGDYVLTGENYMYYPNVLYDNLNNGIPSCPTGYRLPNIREMVAIRTFVTDASWWVAEPYFVSNYYSFGPYGDGQDGGSYTWNVSQSTITVGTGGVDNINIRCVTDVTLDKL